MSWRADILQEFTPALASVTRLTVVSDPDELLVEQGVLDELREAGFELVPFDDPVAFRFQYERRFREVWDRGEPTNLVVVLRTPQQDVEDLPFDLLEEARRENRVLRFNIAELFPQFVPAVVRSLDRRWFEALWRAVQAHQPAQLGDQQTRDFILRHVFEVIPELIKSPTHLLRVLLERHYKGIVAPTAIDEFLIARLRATGAWMDWPLEQIVPNRESFFAFLQERWPRFLSSVGTRTSGPGYVAAPEIGYGMKVPGPLDLPFEHDDVRVYIDNLFAEGLLSPVQAQDDIPTGWWSLGVAHADPAALAAARWQRLTTIVEDGIPPIDADRMAWLAFAPRFAEWLALGWSLGTRQHDIAAASLHDRVEERFTVWMLAHFAGLANQPYWPSPTMVHHIPHFLSMALKRKESAKCAMVVVDGLAIDQWAVLRDGLQTARGGTFQVEEGAVFAWVPTLTGVSRQAIFAGTVPFMFASSLGTTHKEMGQWEKLWAEAGLLGPAVGYVGHGKVAWDSFLDDVRAKAEHHRCRALGVVVNTIDRTMHGMEQGSSGMHAMVRHWATTGELQTLLGILFDNGFDVWLTSDHGNIEGVGIGKPDVGLTAEQRGERVHVFQTAIQRDQLATSFPGSVSWRGAGLPDEYHPLLAPKRAAFVNQGTVIVGHGGISVEEVIVPFVRVRRQG
jgi:hypothetical protein